VSQQVDGAVPNAAHFRGQYDAVKRTLASGTDCPDQHTELVCKRDKPLFDNLFSIAVSVVVALAIGMTRREADRSIGALE